MRVGTVCAGMRGRKVLPFRSASLLLLVVRVIVYNHGSRLSMEIRSLSFQSFQPFFLQLRTFRKKGCRWSLCGCSCSRCCAAR